MKFDELNESNYIMFAIKHYNNPQAVTQEDFYDDMKPLKWIKRRLNKYKKSVELNEETIRSFDLVLISTAHDSVNYQELGQWAEVIVDTRNAMSEVNNATAQVYPA